MLFIRSLKTTIPDSYTRQWMAQYVPQNAFVALTSFREGPMILEMAFSALFPWLTTCVKKATSLLLEIQSASIDKLLHSLH